MDTPSTLRVQFAHGLEGSPHGIKARYLAQRFEAFTPHMDTRDFRGCVQTQREALQRFDPHVLVGSSFGGGVVLKLLQDGDWTGPTLLLAQAGIKMGLPAMLPAQVPVLLAHGTQDDVVSIEDSRKLARSGSPEQVELVEIDDGHGLGRLVREDELARLVHRVYEPTRRG